MKMFIAPGYDPITSGIAEDAVLQKGMEEKSKEFAEKGSALYAKA